MTRYSLGKICAAHAALALGLQRAWRLARLPSSPPPRACATNRCPSANLILVLDAGRQRPLHSLLLEDHEPVHHRRVEPLVPLDECRYRDREQVHVGVLPNRPLDKHDKTLVAVSLALAHTPLS
eukprot:CAMPEP_0175330866 /NCGR_PEP_ID=MMETSP0095-20121207/948_1 /TAXON_ID=311494 /ORGANISM="Alexandrium monilatum, Strain CCMP3105" /LENGTH=123 /DNA_ID=CAMNT_0016628067 /DNA_START=330 /DNA_END=701 /DNA_ORIENTATION=+